MHLVASVFSLKPLDSSDVLTIVGFTATLLGLFFTYRQIAQSRRTAQGQFLLQINDHFRHFDKLHRSLLDENRRDDWTPPREDWTTVVQYMGLFERCKILIDSGTLDPAVFERLYGYRFRNLVNTRTIRDKYLLDKTRSGGWRDFLALWADMDRALLKRTGKRPYHSAPSTLPEPSAE